MGTLYSSVLASKFIFIFFLGKDTGRPWHTYEAFQKIIKEQVKSLIDLGADPALKVRFFFKSIKIH